MLTCALYECGIPVARDSDLCPRHTGEAETAARIVAWLRAEAKRCRDRGESWKVPSTDAAIAAHTDIYADAIERGDWRNGGDTRD